MKVTTTSPSSSPIHSTTLRKNRLFSPFIFTLLAFIIFVAILYGQDLSCTFSSRFDQRLDDHVVGHSPFTRNSVTNNNFVDPKTGKKDGGSRGGKKKKSLPFAVGTTEEGCNIFDGRWVWDKESKPMYEEWECPYIQPQLTCQEHGRPDRDYQFWRWQPNHCDLPRFNATLMLEALRGKRMLFVGDSLNRGQFVSMVCLLHKLVPEDEKLMEDSYDSLTVFRLKEYNASIEFYWAPFLLESNSDNAVVHRIADRIVRKASIKKHGDFWKGADIMVFNTYLWWMTGLKMKILKGSFQDEEQEIEELSTEDAYRMAMKSMLHWVERNTDRKKTRVFFTGMSPTHGKSEDWGGEPGNNCYNETTMIKDPEYWGSDSRKTIMKVIGEEFSKTKVPISFLNITQLSGYRKDAHTQIYKKQWSPLTPQQAADPKSYADCVHWCLPGLQDTWNELLFAKLFYP